MTEQQTMIRAGYKQTEVGVIPEEWDVSTVGREFEIKLGKMLDAEKNVGVPKPYLGNKAVQWDQIDISDLPTVPMSRADIENFRLRKGDLLVCEGGEVGRAAIWNAPIEEGYYQKALHRLRPLRGYDSRLMVALLRQWSARGLLANYVTQTSIAHLPREKFLEVPMPLPPPPEQCAIAGASSDVDTLISGLETLIAKKRDLKRAAIQQLLTGKRRLSGFGGEWEMKRLGDIFNVTAGGDFDPSQSSSIQDERHCYPIYSNSVSEKGLYGFCSYNDHEADSITVTARGTLGVANYRDRQFTAIGRVLVLVPKESVDGRFFSEFINSRIEFVVESTGVPQLTAPQISKYTLPMPSFPEQKIIATVLSDIDAEIAALEQRRDKTRAIKQGMMEELLTGKIRLI